MTDHEKALLEAYERGYAKGVEDEAARQPAWLKDPEGRGGMFGDAEEGDPELRRINRLFASAVWYDDGLGMQIDKAALEVALSDLQRLAVGQVPSEVEEYGERPIDRKADKEEAEAKRERMDQLRQAESD